MQICAVADDVKFKCDDGPIVFKPTMMFQARSFSFPLENTSLVKLAYYFFTTYPDGTPDRHIGPYQVTPARGTVQPGQAQTITVKFVPREVEDCARILACDMPMLDAEQKPIRRELNGRALRPWCHFELPDSDYISSGRRRPDMPGPDGGMSPPDHEKTKVPLKFKFLYNFESYVNCNAFLLQTPTALYTFQKKSLSCSNLYSHVSRDQISKQSPSHDVVSRRCWRWSLWASRCSTRAASTCSTPPASATTSTGRWSTRRPR